jgi:uncharacterized protein (TIGR03083 family)
MDDAGYVRAIERESAAFAAAVEADLEAGVPCCPGWNVADLVWHLGEVQAFWSEIVDRRLQSPEAVATPVRPPTEDLVAWFRSTSARLRSALEDAAPTDPVWTWASQRDVGFVRRRQAQEAAVHRWDAESAVGSPAPIEVALAADGVEEFLEFMLSPDELAGGRDVIALRATDAAVGWHIVTGGRRLEWSRTDGDDPEADAVVSASASDLDLLLWRRVRPNAVRIQGDRAALERFLARADLD